MVSGRGYGTGLKRLSPAILSINTPAKLNLLVGRAYRSFGLPADSEIIEVFMQRGIVWVVDDDSSIRWVLKFPRRAGLTCTFTFENGNEAPAALASKMAGQSCCRISGMPGMDGLALPVKQIKQRHPMPGHHYDRAFDLGCRRERSISRGRLIICLNQGLIFDEAVAWSSARLATIRAAAA